MAEDFVILILISKPERLNQEARSIASPLVPEI